MVGDEIRDAPDPNVIAAMRPLWMLFCQSVMASIGCMASMPPHHLRSRQPLLLSVSDVDVWHHVTMSMYAAVCCMLHAACTFVTQLLLHSNLALQFWLRVFTHEFDFLRILQVTPTLPVTATSTLPSPTLLVTHTGDSSIDTPGDCK